MPERFREITELPARIFAIGDIHGCPAEMQILLEFLRDEQGLCNQDLVVFIGDYIDRGNESREVINLLLDFQKSFAETLFLRGNHEDMLLQYLGFEGNEGWAYLYNGGANTLKSYGLPLEATPENVLNAIPREHISFLLNLERYLIVGDHVFVHAGLNSQRDLRSQLDRDLFWIRDDFINNIHHFGKTVVFGHTPYRDVLLHVPYKIGIDTGLVFSNMLTCVEVLGKQIFQVKHGKKKVEVYPYEEKLPKRS